MYITHEKFVCKYTSKIQKTKSLTRVFVKKSRKSNRNVVHVLFSLKYSAIIVIFGEEQLKRQTNVMNLLKKNTYPKAAPLITRAARFSTEH